MLEVSRVIRVVLRIKGCDLRILELFNVLFIFKGNRMFFLVNI